MSKMTDAQRKDYKHQLRVLQAARAAMKEARKTERERRENQQKSLRGVR